MAAPLAQSLEFILIGALLDKEITYEELDKKHLSHLGKEIHKAVQRLAEGKGEWDVNGVVAVVTDVFGQDKGRVADYLAHASKLKSVNGKDIHKLLQDRSLLIALSNEIQSQLGSGDLDVSRLQAISAVSSSIHSDLRTAERELLEGTPEPPSGPLIQSLPRLSEATHGMFGLWLVGGLPAVGKSTLAAQMAVDVGQYLPVLYYDFENGRQVMLYRLVQNWGIERARQLGANLYIRESIRSLSSDLAAIKPPAVIVVDSIQKIPLYGHSGDDPRVGLNRWIRRFEELKQQGYTVVLISEIPREKYTGDPRMDMFKESGALEYAADAATALVPRGDFVQVHIVKNRHYPTKGNIGLLEREKDWWFKELDVTSSLGAAIAVKRIEREDEKSNSFKGWLDDVPA